MRELTAGDALDQYRLGELLARSGMASIFKATDTESGVTVALKIPHMQFESDVVFFERFKREESIGQKLDHPHIVKVLKPRAKSRMYIAMEYVEGKSLRAIMQASGALPADKALDIAQQVGDALVYLHARKVVHRDLKPENVLLTADGQVKILDFGIALDETARRLTWAGLSSAVGTPDYMAPEQIGGRRGDERTDVYALGTMVFEMLAGDLPHEAPNPQALLSAKTHDDPRPLSYFLPAVDPALDAVVVRAIQRSPRDRYQTMAQFLTDLRDPKAAVHADGSRTTTPARRRFRAVRRAAVPIAVLMIFAGLIALVALSHRAAAPPPAAHREK
jgi:eukaryotic-like serine/threonine-protein kinase